MEVPELDLLAEFRHDHWRARAGLLRVIQALESKDYDEAKDMLSRLDDLTGPHFRFEEEALYPALRRFLKEYVNRVLNTLDRLLEERKALVDAMHSNAELLEQGPLGDEEIARVADTVRALLAHVSDCDRLATLLEGLKPQEFERLAGKYAAARRAAVPERESEDTST
jgi:hypothetical protein